MTPGPEAAAGRAATAEAPQLTEADLTFRPDRVGLEGRLLIHSALPAALNPNPLQEPVTEAQLGYLANRSYVVQNAASSGERHAEWAGRSEKTLDARLTAWRKEMVDVIGGAGNADKRTVLQKLSHGNVGIDFANFKEAQADALYSRYFKNQETQQLTVREDGKDVTVEVSSNMRQFVQDVIGSYRNAANNTIDVEALRRDLPTIQWLSNSFGRQSSQVVAHMINAEVALITDRAGVLARLNASTETTAATAETPAQTVRAINNLDAIDKRILTFLGGITGRLHERTAQTTTPDGSGADAEGTETPDARRSREMNERIKRRRAQGLTPEQTTLVNEAWASETFKDPSTPLEILTAAKGDPDKEGPYYVKPVPETFDVATKLRKERITELRSLLPFYINIGHDPDNGSLTKWQMNPDAVPYYDMYHGDLRFRHANAFVRGQAGLFGLAAIAAETPADQARLYRHLGRSILHVHTEGEQNAPLAHLRAWLDAQRTNQGNGLDIFARNDRQAALRTVANQDQTGNELERHGREIEAEKALGTERSDVMLAYTVNGTVANYSPDATQALWVKRVKELQTILDDPNGKLERHHYQWIEFLSHSVKVPEMLDTIRGKSIFEGLDAEIAAARAGQAQTDNARRDIKNARSLEQLEKLAAEVRAGNLTHIDELGALGDGSRFLPNIPEAEKTALAKAYADVRAATQRRGQPDMTAEILIQKHEAYF